MHVTISKQLPGRSAQIEMAPPHRIAGLKNERIPDNAVDAAVLVLLTPVNAGASRLELMDWQVLLIHRNRYPGVHSGQIAFPGGKCEQGDNGFCDTACREAFEEVGVTMSPPDTIGSLTSIYVPPSNFVMHPFVAVNAPAQTFRPDPREVADYKNIPIKVFNPAEAVMVDFDYEHGSTRPAPAWNHEGYVIWGATAMILAELYHLVDDEGFTVT